MKLHGSRVGHALVPLVLVGLFGCMKRAPIGSAALVQFGSMYSFPRESYGFTSLPSTGSVLIEGPSKSGGYDAMLHFDSPSRTIAFRKKEGRLEWSGEQEIFVGPREYKTVDGSLREQIVITYYAEAASGESAGLTIGYNGPDQKLNEPRPNINLSKEDVTTLMKAWGYWH